jgi:hypothetical protein
MSGEQGCKVAGCEFKVLPKMHGKWSGVHCSILGSDLTKADKAGTTRVWVDQDSWHVKSTETDSGGGTKILKCSYIPVKDGQFRVEHDDNGLNITGHEDVDSDSVFIEFRNSSGHLLTKQEVSVHNQSLVSYVREFEEDGTLKATSMWVERKVDESGNEEGSN